MEFATKEARLKSFEPPTKRSKAGWPHKSPTADAIATAGFYYTPHKIGEDNVKCFMCDAKLDGWEKDDDPVQEHLRHSPECGYAILMSLVQQPHFDTEAMEDPTSTAMEKARRSTFDLGWPHDSKRGWTCKTEKMVEAGWHFMPSSVSEDYASCAYCKLSLDGWEPKDNPFDEHYRRNPDCPFFVFAGTTAPSKRGKAKRGGARSSRASRASKASTRLSTDSNAMMQSEIPDLDDSIDTSTTSVASNMSKASTASKKRKAAGGAKTTRAKKAKIEPEPEPEPIAEPEAIEVVEPELPEEDETVDNSTASMLSTMSTATAKGKKKAAPRTKATRAKKTKATKPQKTKKAEAEIIEPVEVEESQEVGLAAEAVQAVDFVEAVLVKESEKVVEILEESEISSIVRNVPEAPAVTSAEEPLQYPDLAIAAAGSPLQHKSSPYPSRSSPGVEIHAHTSPFAGPARSPPPRSPSVHSPAKSDIENAPPSSLPPSSRPPQPQMTPSRTRPAATWSPVDVDLVFANTPGGALGTSNLISLAQAEQLSDKERNMTVQEWIEYLATTAESDLKQESERVVGMFEREGARAMGVLEAVECM